MKADKGTIDVILQSAAPAFFAKGKQGAADFAELVRDGLSDSEGQKLDAVTRALRRDLTNEQTNQLVETLREEEFILDMIIARFIRSTDRPALVRGDIAAVSKRVDSLAGKAAQIASEIRNLDRSLHDQKAAGINLVAAGTSFAVDEVSRAIADLQAAMQRLAAARDVALPDSGRRVNEARIRLACDLMILLEGVGRELVEAVVASIVEAVEGPVGSGQGEWIGPLMRDASAILAVAEWQTEPPRIF